LLGYTVNSVLTTFADNAGFSIDENH